MRTRKTRKKMQNEGSFYRQDMWTSTTTIEQSIVELENMPQHLKKQYPPELLSLEMKVRNELILRAQKSVQDAVLIMKQFIYVFNDGGQVAASYPSNINYIAGGRRSTHYYPYYANMYSAAAHLVHRMLVALNVEEYIEYPYEKRQHPEINKLIKDIEQKLTSQAETIKQGSYV